jgi:UTP--glucose-1-phosphate uridylyltransferase
MSQTTTLPLADSERAFLRARHFDEASFLHLQRRVRSGELTERDSHYPGELKPPGPSDVDELPAPGTPRGEALAKRGTAALRAGELAVVVLAGGMATRFGGEVKGAVDVLPGKSFLQLKLEGVRRVGQAAGKPVPFCVMTSFATTEGIRTHLKERGLEGPDVHLFEQGVSLRLTPKGELYRDPAGQVSFYAPGHGDFFVAFRQSGLLPTLRAQGVRHVFWSNVDNLGATLDPRVVGYHLEKGVDLTAEVTAKNPGDKGGTPVVADGRLRLLEGLRFPPSVDQSRYPELSLNTFTFALDGLDRDVPLTPHLVSKKVDGQDVLQVETISCEATEAVDAAGRPLFSLAVLRVPREGPEGRFYEGRFYPVKDRADLEKVAARLARGG